MPWSHKTSSGSYPGWDMTVLWLFGEGFGYSKHSFCRDRKHWGVFSLSEWEHREEKISCSFSIGAPAGNLQVSWHGCQARACPCSLASSASRSVGWRAERKGRPWRLWMGLGGTKSYGWSSLRRCWEIRFCVGREDRGKLSSSHQES